MPTPHKPAAPTTAAIDAFCAHFDDLFARYEERRALRHYLSGLLLPREHNKTLVELTAIVPGADRQALHHFLHEAPWDAEALNQRRLELWQAHPVVAVTSQWTDVSRQVPVGVKPNRPASRLPKGRKDPDFHSKPELAWQLIDEARATGIPFRLVVADSVCGENLTLEARLYVAGISYIMGLRPSHGTWQEVIDPAHPPAFTPAEAAARLPHAA